MSNLWHVGVRNTEVSKRAETGSRHKKAKQQEAHRNPTRAGSHFQHRPETTTRARRNSSNVDPASESRPSVSRSLSFSACRDRVRERERERPRNVSLLTCEKNLEKLCVYIYICMHVCMHVCICIHVYIYIHMCTYIFFIFIKKMYMPTRVYIYVYVVFVYAWGLAWWGTGTWLH